MADDFGRDALTHFALGFRIDGQREIGVRLDIDEAGRYREARGIDGVETRSFERRTDSGNAVAVDSDVRARARDACAVDHEAVLNENIEVHGRRLEAHARFARGE